MSERLLDIRNLSVTFGGLNALTDLDFHVDKGEIVSVIGPNGAGKTTFFNMISGMVTPTSGDIVFKGESLLGLDPNQVTARGIARTFQNVRLFANMTILENVMVSQHCRTKQGIMGALFQTGGFKREEQEIREHGEKVLGFFGSRLVGYRLNQPASVLSYANRRRLEIARAMATKPEVILLDEPVAGMNPKESEELTGLIGKLRDEWGFTIVMIEHDMGVVRELVCLLGGNASGKSTTLKTLLGMVTPTTGEVVLDGEVVNDKPTLYRVERGVTMVPENRRLFKRLTVKENLELGAYLRNDDGVEADLERIYEMFPRVKERLNQKSGTLSGGEQQMVAMGRALMANPRVLLMDEPSMGLAPALVQTNFELIQQIHEEGVAIFMVEQNANMALSIADRGWVLQTGRVVLDDSAEALLANPELRASYLGDGNR
ncbi:MAG: ATP-binding cassette domain-containing protein [Actinobacteria bacterium]|nr:ATP-binding cassette domain-containing protein [Actinomycetota bacterium]